MSTTNILDLNNRIDELAVSYPAAKVMLSDGVTSVEEKIGNMRITKLWENPNPTSDFAAQNIMLSSADYNMLLIIYRATKSSDTELSHIIQKGANTILDIADYNNSVASNRYRAVTYSSATQYAAAAGSVNGTTNNGVCIPYQIYGIKLT